MFKRLKCSPELAPIEYDIESQFTYSTNTIQLQFFNTHMYITHTHTDMYTYNTIYTNIYT